MYFLKDGAGRRVWWPRQPLLLTGWFGPSGEAAPRPCSSSSCQISCNSSSESWARCQHSSRAQCLPLLQVAVQSELALMGDAGSSLSLWCLSVCLYSGPLPAAFSGACLATSGSALDTGPALPRDHPPCLAHTCAAGGGLQPLSLSTHSGSVSDGTLTGTELGTDCL